MVMEICGGATKCTDFASTSERSEASTDVLLASPEDPGTESTGQHSWLHHSAAQCYARAPSFARWSSGGSHVFALTSAQ